jgi:ribosome-associated protein
VDTSQLDQELQFRAIRGSGPGGQHVNKVATKVELRWKLTDTKAFNETEISRLSAKL